ncbi:MAG: hybrid sensor histidine kinase/response regulator [Gammaproteobacteria bacterium]|nr:hybrid sensor histidine kinase/response regulator [Gammaproteobacteria bacterium]
MQTHTQDFAPLAATLVRKVFSVYLVFAVVLTLLQVSVEYRDTYSAVRDELDSTLRAFEPGLTNAVWNYQQYMVSSIAAGMVNGGAITAVDIGDSADHLRVTMSQGGNRFDPQGISKHIDLFHTDDRGIRQRIGFVSLYSSHDIVIERVKFGVLLIIISSVIKTIGLWLIIVFFANRLLARPLRRFTEQIGSFDLASATKAPVVDLGSTPSEELVYLRDTFTDLTERAVANKQLVIQKQAAEAANLAKSRFLAAASHDLRQPMHALTLYLGTLTSFDLPNQARTLLAKTRQCAHSMDEMFRDLLDMSRLDAAALQPEINNFPVAPILERIRVQFEPEAQAKGLELRVAPCSAWAVSDPAMVERMLRNLVCNAVRYTERGRILVGGRRGQATLRLAVFDTGPGIPADKRQAIFAEFYQLDNGERERGKGLGLGLAIVDRLAQLLSAPITVISRPAHGSMFAFDLSLGHAQAAAAMPHLPNVEHDRTDSLITIIDDDAQILDAMRARLERWGYAIVTATSPNEAIAKLRAGGQLPDAIICDYRLRGEENGIDAVAGLRAEFNRTIPALLITGDTAVECIDEIHASGLPMLHKPIKEDALNIALIALIAGHLHRPSLHAVPNDVPQE